MKLVKSLLLAAPAMLIAAAAAQAADLPSREAAPIHYVRICDAYGSGFFFIPGTNTCLRVGGYVRFEGQYTPGHNVITATGGTFGGVAFAPGAVTQAAADQDTTGMEVRGRVDLDARTQTQWGTAQTVIWLRGAVYDGIKAQNPGASTYTAILNGGYIPAAGPATVTLERAFIRFAGITAGVATDNFETMPPYMYALGFAGFPSGVKELAYTATFGGGFSSTLAIESRADTGNSPNVAQYTYVNQPDTGYNLEGNVRYDGSWGFVQLSGALGNNSFRNNLLLTPNSVNLTNQPTNNLLTGPTTQGAYAVSISGMFKVPMIAPGDKLNYQFTYGHGMFGLVGCTQGVSDCNDPTSRRWLGGVLRYDNNLIPISVGGAPGTPGNITFGTTDSYSLNAMYTHYWSPTWRSNFAGLYQRINEPVADVSAGLQLGNANVYVAGANLIWSPAKNFDIGVELDYMHMDQVLQNVATAAPLYAAAGQPGLSNDGFTGRLRLEREF